MTDAAEDVAHAEQDDPHAAARIRAAFRSGPLDAALAAAAAHLQHAPEDLEVLALLADGCLRDGRVPQARALYEALAGAARTAPNLTGLALALSAAGEAGAAKPLFLEALEADPLHPGAWTGLSEIHRFTEGDPLLAALRGAIAAARRARELSSRLHYVLCKAMNDLGRWDEAWRSAETGAALAEARHDPAPLRLWAADQAAVVNAALLAEKAQREVPSDGLIFIIGAPRCGSSLLEMMLSKLPGVAATGERRFVPELAERRAAQGVARGGPHPTYAWLRDWEGAEIAALAGAYIQDGAGRAAAAGAAGAVRFVDKGLENITCLPHLAILFPGAKVIRLRRDPLDACVSMLLGRFAHGGAAALRPDWLAEAWALRQRMADRMAAHLPTPPLELRYEDLAADPAAEMRRVVAFLGLDWDPACATPENAPAACVTRSRGQVRSGVTGASVGRWRRYGAHVRPLAEALRANGVEVDGAGM